LEMAKELSKAYEKMGLKNIDSTKQTNKDRAHPL